MSQVHSDIRVEQGGSDTPPPAPQPVLRVEPEARPSAPAPAPAPPARPVAPAAEVKPTPVPQPPAVKLRGPAADNGLALARDTQSLTRRVTAALVKRPALSGLPIGVQSRPGVVTVSGKVPSAYEAMLVYRTVEQTPGVRDVLDRLEFQLPDENHPNPLKERIGRRTLPFTSLLRSVGILATLLTLIVCGFEETASRFVARFCTPRTEPRPGDLAVDSVAPRFPAGACLQRRVDSLDRIENSRVLEISRTRAVRYERISSLVNSCST